MRNHGRTPMLTARIGIALWTAAWLGALAPAPARAEQGGAEDQAVAHHERGLEHYQAGRYAEAAREFEAAQALLPAPENLFNLARCYERLGDVARAIAMFERYVEADLPPDRRARGQAELERLRAAAGGSGPAPAAEVDLVVVTTPAGAEVLVDGRPQPQRTPAVIRVTPGPHVVEARLAGHAEARQELSIDPGSAGRIELVLQPAPAAAGDVPPGGAEAAPRPDARRVRLTGAIHLGAGGSFRLDGGASGNGALITAELAGGLDLGRARSWRRVTFWPVRLELLVGVAAALGGESSLVALGGGGRLSLALFQIPLRLEGELAGAWVYDGEAAAPNEPDNAALTAGLSLLFQPISWLEVGLRAARVDFVFVEVSGSGSMAYRFGFDAFVRFRI